LFKQIAGITGILAEIHRDRTRRGMEYTADDFCLLRDPGPAKVQTAEQQMQIFRFLTTGIGEA
jgi:hypothetical protein